MTGWKATKRLDKMRANIIRAMSILFVKIRAQANLKRSTNQKRSLLNPGKLTRKKVPMLKTKSYSNLLSRNSKKRRGLDKK